MTPYYQDDLVTIYHSDCLNEPQLWAGGDVLVTDPPYGMSFVSNASKYGSTDPIAGDDDTAARDDVLSAWGDRPALVFGTWRLPRPEATRHLLIWDKGDSPGMGDLALPWGHSCEEIYVLGDGWVGKRRGNVIRVPGLAASDPKRLGHPTPKPLGLMTRLIENCPPGVIVDPFLGSGTTLRAAKDLGRRAIGVEKDERYCERAALRMAQEVLDFG